MAERRVPTTTKVQGMIDAIKWMTPVLDKGLTTPPESGLATGDRYLVISGDSATDWSGHDNEIAEYNGVTWDFTSPLEGMVVLVRDEIDIYAYNGSNWVKPYGEGTGDMLKSVYDTDEDGIVDKAETIDDGAGNSATAVDVKDAVDKKHTHANKTTLDLIEEAFTSALKTAYDGAVTDSHTHTNKVTLDLIEEALTSALKTNYDKAYSSRAKYDASTDEIVFTDPDAV